MFSNKEQTILHDIMAGKMNQNQISSLIAETIHKNNSVNGFFLTSLFHFSRDKNIIFEVK